MKKRLTNWFPLQRQVSASIALSCWSFSWRKTSSAPMKWTASICSTVSITWNPEVLCQPAHPNTNQYSQTSILTSFHLNKRELGYGNSSGVWKSLQRLGIAPKLQPTHWKRSSQKSRNPFRWKVPALSSQFCGQAMEWIHRFALICHDLMSSIPFLVSLAKASNGKLVAHATFLVKVSHCGVANFSDLETPLEQMSSGSNIPGSWRALWKPSKSSSPADSRVEWKQKLQLQMANKCKQYIWICVRRE